MAYATLEEIKLRLEIQVSTYDAVLEGNLDAASAQIDQYCRRTFSKATTATARIFDDIGAWRNRSWSIVTDDYWELGSVKFDTDDDGTFETTISTGYAYPRNAAVSGRPFTAVHLREGTIYTYPRGGVEVTAKWGWPSVPAPIKEATLLQASRLFKRKDSPEGTLGMADFGVMTIARFDADVRELCGPFKAFAFGAA